MDALDQYVNELRRNKGEDVPAFSSYDGRIGAKVLFLLRDPGKSGASKTGVVDRGNPDSTAGNFRDANQKADLDRMLTISWNAVSWPIGGSTFARELDKVRQEGWLNKLLGLLPQLSVVILLGGDAHKLTPDLYDRCPDIHVLHGPHPA